MVVDCREMERCEEQYKVFREFYRVVNNKEKIYSKGCQLTRNVEKIRKEQQARVVSLIEETAKSKGIHIQEAPTGFGKTIVSILGACRIVKNSKKGVIVSTSNNSLAKQFMDDARRNSNLDIPVDKFVLDLGRKNYLDYSLALTSIVSDKGLLYGKITLDELDDFIAEQIELHPYIRRETVLLSDLKIFLELKGYIVSEDSLVIELAQSAHRKDTAKYLGEMFRYLEEGMVVVTNHYYLLTLSKYGNFSAFGYPIIADEVQAMSTAAESVFASSFSFIAFRNLLAKLILLNKEEKIYSPAVTGMLDKLHDSAKGGVAESNKIILDGCYGDCREAIRDIAVRMKKEIITATGGNVKGINRLDTSTRSTSQSHKIAGSIIGSVVDLLHILDKSFSVDVSSAANVTIKYATARPMFNLQSIFWRKIDAGFIGLSATIRTSSFTSKDSNEWSFFWLGLMSSDIKRSIDTYVARHKPSEELLEDYRKYLEHKNESFEKMTFDVIPPLFERKRFWSYFAEQDLTPPSSGGYIDFVDEESGKKGRKKLFASREELAIAYKEWYKKIAVFVDANIFFSGLVLTMATEDAIGIAQELNELSLGRYEVLCPHEDESVYSIVEKHKANIAKGVKSVIVGNGPFYVGIDLPGKELQQTFIARLPFEPGRVTGKKETTKSGGYSALSDVLKKMIIGLRQGIGRTIRSEHDHGVVYILDGRIHSQRNSEAKAFVEEVSVEHKLTYIKENLYSFLETGHADYGTKFEHSEWFCEKIFGSSSNASSIEPELQELFNERAYKLKTSAFLSNQERVKLISSRYKTPEDALLGAYLLRHEKKSGEDVTSSLIKRYENFTGAAREFILMGESIVVK